MTFLDVPFREKDLAKSLGARWDAISKKWYVPAELSDQLEPFQKWLPQESGLTDMAEQSDASARLDLNEPPKGIQLSVVLRKVQQALIQSFPGATWVIAEIANLNTRRGHVYLELTESNSQGQTIANCRAMIWQSQAQGLLQRFENETGSSLTIGQKVLLLTEVSFHEQYGFSMVIQDIDPSYTLGELEQNLSNIRKQLVKEGLYQRNKHYHLPTDFFRVAVIAPPNAAGLGDFRADADNLQSAGLCQFKYFYSAFQGESVESEMMAAMEAIHALHSVNPFDALVVIRGGGAKLDLNMLNVYSIAKQICEAKLPVLTGIGHERDSTILDEVSHTRFDTPSKVIAFIRHEIFHQAQQAKSDWLTIERSSRLMVNYLQQDLSQLNQGITHNSQNALYRWRQVIEPLQYQVQRLGESAIQTATSDINELMQTIDLRLKNQLNVTKIELERYKETTRNESQRVLEVNRQQVIQWIALVLSSGPKTQLNRGFNIAKDFSSGKPVTTAHNAILSKKLQLEFADGSVVVDVDEKTGLLKP